MPLIPPQYFDCVVAIGVGKGLGQLNWVGTGFLYGVPAGKEDDDGNALYGVFLISNKHIFRDKDEVWLKFNAADDSPSKDYRVTLKARNNKPIWIGHEDDDVDIAALPINVQHLQKDGRRLQFFNEERNVLTEEELAKTSVSEGDGVFMLGFPLGMVDRERQYVICRSGVIARISDVRSGHGREILIDGFAFPGNSGGPVVTKPELVSIENTEPYTRASLLGVVASYIPYQEVARSDQTKRPRMIFEENSGLSSVFPAKLIRETAALAKKRMSGRVAQRRYQAKKRAEAGN